MPCDSYIKRFVSENVAEIFSDIKRSRMEEIVNVVNQQDEEFYDAVKYSNKFVLCYFTNLNTCRKVDFEVPITDQTERENTMRSTTTTSNGSFYANLCRKWRPVTNRRPTPMVKQSSVSSINFMTFLIITA